MAHEQERDRNETPRVRRVEVTYQRLSIPAVKDKVRCKVRMPYLRSTTQGHDDLEVASPASEAIIEDLEGEVSKFTTDMQAVPSSVGVVRTSHSQLHSRLRLTKFLDLKTSGPQEDHRLHTTDQIKMADLATPAAAAMTTNGTDASEKIAAEQSAEQSAEQTTGTEQTNGADTAKQTIARPDKPDENAYKTELAAAEKELAACNDRMVRRSYSSLHV